MAIFSNDKVTPLGGEGSVSSSESDRCLNTIVEKLPIEAFETCAEHGAGVEVDRGIGGAEAEAELVVPFLVAGAECAHHGRVDVSREFILQSGHCGMPLRVSRR